MKEIHLARLERLAKERLGWLMRPDTGVILRFHTGEERTFWHAGIPVIGGILHEGIARTKVGAINNSIRAERKAMKRGA